MTYQWDKKISLFLFSLKDCRYCQIASKVIRRIEIEYNIEAIEIIFTNREDAFKSGISTTPSISLRSYGVDVEQLFNLKDKIIERYLNDE